MKNIFNISIIIIILVIGSCKKETPDDLKRPAPFVRYDHKYLTDTFTTKTANQFAVFMFSHNGITDYKIWLDDSLLYDNNFSWDDASSEEYQLIYVNFQSGVPSTKRIITWIKDRRNQETRDTLRVDYLGGLNDPRIIRFNTALTYGNLNHDGRIYKTIQIANYTWMAQNAGIRYNSGYADTLIYSTLPPFGFYYNWTAARNIQLPAGYMLPTKAHYDNLIAHLGGTTLAGGAMKEAGYGHWELPNAGATNASGFTALGTGVNSTGYWKQQGVYWTGTEYNADSAFAIELSKNSTYAGLRIYPKSTQLPVRLVSAPELNVQQMLDNGKAPKEIINSGVSADSLLGKKYLGGRIVMFDYLTNKGMVMAETDLGSIVWCSSTGTTAANGAGYWTGMSNTLKIYSGCGTMGNAAAACVRSEVAGWKDWYLPSWYELGLAISMLKDRVPGFFPTAFDYWSSTEVNSTDANYSGWDGTNTTGGSKAKSQQLRVRAVRTF
jgi:uncharacterized protein (TIGR02145 family)